jgi:hypothetical protein
MINAVQSTGNVVSVCVYEIDLKSFYFRFFKFVIADDGQIKKFVKRDVSEIQTNIDSNESGENYSTESSEEEVTDDVQNLTTESGSMVTLNLDPYRQPKEEEEKEVEEISIKEQTKSADDLNSSDLELNTENTELELTTTNPSDNEEEIINDENSTVSTIDITANLDVIINQNEQNEIADEINEEVISLKIPD